MANAGVPAGLTPSYLRVVRSKPHWSVGQLLESILRDKEESLTKEDPKGEPKEQRLTKGEPNEKRLTKEVSKI